MRAVNEKIKRFIKYIWWFVKKILYLHSQTTNGTMAEWLGSGLQNRVQQFDSAWYLKEGDSIELPSFFFATQLSFLRFFYKQQIHRLIVLYYIAQAEKASVRVLLKTRSQACGPGFRGIGRLSGRMLPDLCCQYRELLQPCHF